MKTGNFLLPHLDDPLLPTRYRYPSQSPAKFLRVYGGDYTRVPLPQTDTVLATQSYFSNSKAVQCRSLPSFTCRRNRFKFCQGVTPSMLPNVPPYSTPLSDIRRGDVTLIASKKPKAGVASWCGLHPAIPDLTLCRR